MRELFFPHLAWLGPGDAAEAFADEEELSVVSSHDTGSIYLHKVRVVLLV